MKKILLILFCVATPSVVTGQDFSVSVAPYSFKFWGQVTGTASVSVDYTIPVKGKPVLGVHYFHKGAKKGYGIIDRTTSTFGLSYLPLSYKIFSFGLIGTVNGFPTYHSSHVNFLAKINIPVGNATLSYSHISNGFGLQHGMNYGIDFVSVSYRIK